MPRIFAITTRGLEQTSISEMKSIPGITNITSGYRRVTADIKGSLAPLLLLRSVDDVFFALSAWNDIIPQRAALANLSMNSNRLNLIEATSEIAKIRPIPKMPGFSVTASFVGKRNYSTEEIKQSIATGITSRWNWKYIENDAESDINIRLFIEHENAYVGLRLGKTSLQKRNYKIHHITGSLKPPVAAALVLLADQKKPGSIVDPFCGGGTILTEASMLGYTAIGGDIDTNALLASQENLLTADIPSQISQWDATQLPLPSESFGAVVTNLPWGRQVEVLPGLTPLYTKACQEIERILVPEGRAVILTSFPVLLQFNRVQIDQSLEISLFGQNPTVTIVTKK
jgi:tRNA (guanine6-N2)-methyltransferase